jgi:hypothetical protein
MLESVHNHFDRPWLVRWALGAPIAAAACVVFFARAWGVPWHGYSVAAVALAAWIFGVLAQWPALRTGRERWLAALAVAMASLALVYGAGWRLPRGLLAAAAPVGALAVFQCLLSLGRSHPWLLRVAAVVGSAAALLAVLSVPLEILAPRAAALGTPLRFAVAFVVVAGAVAVWREAGRVRVGDGTQRLARAVLFAAGVWLPMVWWRSEGLVSEFMRWENAAFLVLVLLVAWARPQGCPDGDRSMRRHVALAALLLAGAAAAGFFAAATRGYTPTQTVFLGVGAGALVLSALLAWPRRPGQPPPAFVWWPEVVLVLMPLTAWIR